MGSLLLVKFASVGMFDWINFARELYGDTIIDEWEFW